MIAAIGGAGSGLVWGWFAGGIARPRRASSIGALVGAVLALAGEAFVLAGVAVAVALLGALVVGVGLRAAWMRWLRERVDRTSREGYERVG